MNLKTLFASRTVYRVLALFDWQAESGMAVLTFAVAANLAVAEFVAKISKKVLDFIPNFKEFAVFLTAFVDVS